MSVSNVTKIQTAWLVAAYCWEQFTGVLLCSDHQVVCSYEPKMTLESLIKVIKIVSRFKVNVLWSNVGSKGMKNVFAVAAVH